MRRTKQYIYLGMGYRIIHTYNQKTSMCFIDKHPFGELIDFKEPWGKLGSFFSPNQQDHKIEIPRSSRKIWRVSDWMVERVSHPWNVDFGDDITESVIFSFANAAEATEIKLLFF